MKKGISDYLTNSGNITGFLPRWVFLVFGLVLMVYQTIYYPALESLVLTTLGIVTFFVLDHFAPRLSVWFKERTQNAAAKLDREKVE